jgi:hypothetical protein
MLSRTSSRLGASLDASTCDTLRTSWCSEGGIVRPSTWCCVWWPSNGSYRSRVIPSLYSLDAPVASYFYCLNYYCSPNYRGRCPLPIKRLGCSRSGLSLLKLC